MKMKEVVIMNLNKYQVLAMLHSNHIIYFERFYKSDLIFIIKVMREEYNILEHKLEMLGR